MATRRIKVREKDLEKTRKFNSNNLKEKKQRKKKEQTLWLSWFIFCIAILSLCAFKLGLIITLISMATMIIITGLTYLITSNKGNSKKRKIINIALIAILTIFIIDLLLFGAFLVYITIKAPKFDPKNLDTKELSIVYDKDNNVIAKLGAEKREKVSYEDLPEVLVDAIVSTEDSRFFEHNGFDAPRFVQASLGQALGRNAGGASTLSMQVIKNSFTSTEASGIKGIIRKFTDIYLAVFKLEKKYTKQQIIEFYVNNHSLGGSIYGVEEAAKAYFNKDVSDLNLSEAAIIAGMFKAPNYYKPTTNPENASARRKTVLYLMRKHGYITEKEQEEANAISVESLTGDNAGGSQINAATYQSYIDTVVDEMEDKYNINPYTTSVLIYTNMDKAKQQVVNDVFEGKTYKWKDDKVQGGATVLDSATGKVLAVGAGRNRNIGDYNYATQGKRQPGSTAKPLFDYGPGIEYNNWSTYEQFVDEPYTYSGGRSIMNWDHSYMGQMTLRRALSLSRNIPALKAFQSVDNKKIISFVESLGITPEVENGRIHEAHSIGAFTGVNSMQMAAAYAAFSNGGYYNEPYTVYKYVIRETNETVTHKEDKKKVMSDSTAYMISSVLQDVQLSAGGAIKNVAAKTGTTNFDDQYVYSHNLPLDVIRDSWVVGYTTKTVIGMWYGYNVTTPEYCLRNIPATIAKDKLFKALAKAFEENKEEFKMPDSVVRLNIIQGSNPPKVAPEGYTGAVVSELFKKDYTPDNTNNPEAETKLDKPSNFKGTFTDGKVTLTWNPVKQLSDSYGKVVYNIYKGNTLLKIQDSTTYVDNNPGSGQIKYKVNATYETYNALKGDFQEITVSTKQEVQKKNINYNITYVCGSDKETATGTKEVDATASQAILTWQDVNSTTEQKSALNKIQELGCDITKEPTFVPTSKAITQGETITVTYPKTSVSQ